MVKMKAKIEEKLDVVFYTLEIVIGIILIAFWERSVLLVRDALLLSVGAIIVGHIISRFIINRQFRMVTFLQLFSYIFLFIIISFFLTTHTATIILITLGGLWLVVDGLIKCFYGIQHFRYRRLLSIGYIGYGIGSFFIASILFQLDAQIFFFFRVFIGFYLSVFGLFHLLDEILKQHWLSERLSRFRLFELKPQTLFRLYSPRSFRQHYDQATKFERIDIKENFAVNKDITAESTMDVYIHMRFPVMDMLGHIDFSIDGKNYTYGNYDESTLRWGNNKSDGVFIIVPDETYIKYNVMHFRKIIAKYTLNISNAQKDQLHHAIEALIQHDCIQWDPTTIAKKTSFSKSINNNMRAQFFKFKRESKFFHYITATSNCVNFFQDMTDEADVKMFPNQMLLAPGDIFNILNHYAEDKNDKNVIARQLITKEDYETK